MIDNFNQAMYEMNIILDNTDPKLVKLIPTKILRFINQNAQKEREFIYNKNQKLNEQKISDMTRAMISLIYRDYFCTENEKKEYNIYYKNLKEQIELKKREKYEIEKIFKNNKERKEKNLYLEPYKKISIWTKFKNKFINLFEKLKKN